MVQFLVLSVRFRSFPGNGSFCSPCVIAPFWPRMTVREASRIVFFPARCEMLPVTRAAWKLLPGEEKVIKNEKKISSDKKLNRTDFLQVCLLWFHKVAVNTFLSSCTLGREMKPLSGWVVTVCAAGIDAVETRGNAFKAWVSVVHENLPLQTASLTLGREVNQRKKRAAWLQIVRFCQPPRWGPQDLLSLYYCRDVFFKLDN